MFLALGCGGGDGSGDSGGAQGTADTTRSQPQESRGSDGNSRADQSDKGNVTGGSPEDRRTGADLRGQLRQGEGAAVVTGVDLGRTTITVHTRLPRSEAEAASSLCAQVRRFIAQRPARNTVGRVVIAGRAGVTVTAC